MPFFLRLKRALKSSLKGDSLATDSCEVVGEPNHATSACGHCASQLAVSCLRAPLMPRTRAGHQGKPWIFPHTTSPTATAWPSSVTHLVMLRVCSRTVSGGTVLRSSRAATDDELTDRSSPGARSLSSGEVPSELKDLASSRLSLLQTDRLDESALRLRKLMSSVRSPWPRSASSPELPDHSSREFFPSPESSESGRRGPAGARGLCLLAPPTSSASYSAAAAAASSLARRGGGAGLERILGEGRSGPTVVKGRVSLSLGMDTVRPERVASRMCRCSLAASEGALPFSPTPFCASCLGQKGFTEPWTLAGIFMTSPLPCGVLYEILMTGLWGMASPPGNFSASPSARLSFLSRLPSRPPPPLPFSRLLASFAAAAATASSFLGSLEAASLSSPSSSLCGASSFLEALAAPLSSSLFSVFLHFSHSTCRGRSRMVLMVMRPGSRVRLLFLLIGRGGG
ncbi:hypothetical protein EYF80_025223 [Liparis tanakae]|uniref:Uncharacterized protein n=1 Tax=Liparis tanakae TaxID=230148 RepID=A0A4Z2HFU9_9TELE|nr:hypothetical protein EYF80_025223 [Liparis tanakae]